MKIQELKDLIFEAYIEILREQNEVLPTSTQEILGKFPTLKKTLENLMTPEFETFVKQVNWVAPKPTTFKVDLANGEHFFLKWTGQDFESQIGGKKYYLGKTDEFQQALDKLNELLKYAPIGGEEPAEEAPEDMFGAEPGPEGGEETPVEEPEGGEEVEFEEEPIA